MMLWEQFVKWLESCDCQSLSTGQGFDFPLREHWPEIPQKNRPAFCTTLLVQVEKHLACLESLQAFSEAEPEEQIEQQVCKNGLIKLTAWVQCLLQEDGPSVLPEVLAAAQAIHDRAILAMPSFPDAQEAAVKLCLAWWQADVPGKETLVIQTLPYILMKALTTGKAADIKRCHALRGVLPLLDFDDDASIGDLKGLLLRAAFSPPFLRVSEGRRLLSSLFNLQPQLVRELGSIIRNQITAGRKSVLDGYGDILFRAWRDCQGTCLLEVEGLVQGLMQSCLLAKSTALSTALRRVLYGFHGQKTHAKVDAMLLRLYEPILFRNLSAANSSVRCNAYVLLFDAFPIQDPEASSEEVDELVTRQFQAIEAGLNDSCPAVRSAVAGGLCGLLNTFWELIPPAVIAGHLKRLTSHLVYDASSPMVRTAVLNGLGLLVGNPIAHSLLNATLPSVGKVMWDPSLQVRAAFVELLISIQRTNSLSVTAVISAEDLLYAFGCEQPSVAARLQRLLLPSYFPDAEQGPSLVAYLLRSSPAAGVAFCSFLCGSKSVKGPLVPIEDLLVLAQDLKDHLMATGSALSGAASSKTSKKGKKRKGQQSHNVSPLQSNQSEDEETVDTWGNILEGLAALCTRLADLDNFMDHERSDSMFGSQDLCQLYSSAPDSRSRQAVLRIAQALPMSDAAEALRNKCFEVMANGKGDMAEAELLAFLASLAGSHSGSETLQKLLSPMLESYFGDGELEDEQATRLVQAIQALDLACRDKTVRYLLLEGAGLGLDTVRRAAQTQVDFITGCLKQSQALSGDRARWDGTAAPLVLTLARLAVHSHAATVLHSDDASEAVLRTCPTLSLNQTELQMSLDACLTMTEELLDRLEGADRSLLVELASDDGKQNQRKKSRLRPSAVSDRTWALRCAWQGVLGLTAVLADASTLLPSDSVSVSPRGYTSAARLLTWMGSLLSSVADGDLLGVDSAFSEALGISARLISSTMPTKSEATGLVGFEASGLATSGVRDLQDSQSSCEAQATLLGETLLQAAKARGSRATKMKTFLGNILRYSSAEEDGLAARWIGPLAGEVGTQVRRDISDFEHAQATAASDEDSEKENTDCNRMLDRSKDKGKPQSAAGVLSSFKLDNQLVDALIKAAKAQKVERQLVKACQGLALSSASDPDLDCCLGATFLAAQLCGGRKAWPDASSPQGDLSRTKMEFKFSDGVDKDCVAMIEGFAGLL